MNDQSEAYDDLANMLRALGHPVRLNILRIVASRGRNRCCCTDVTQSLPLAQSTVSQHIKVLLEAGLIERKPQGTRSCYVVRHDRLALLDKHFDGFLAGVMPARTALHEAKETA